MNIKVQQEFEVWARSQCMQLKKDGCVTTYAYERTDLAWQAWQASRESLVIELPESGMAAEFQYSTPVISRDAVFAAHKAAGLKVKP